MLSKNKKILFVIIKYSKSWTICDDISVTQLNKLQPHMSRLFTNSPYVSKQATTKYEWTIH